MKQEKEPIKPEKAERQTSRETNKRDVKDDYSGGEDSPPYGENEDRRRKRYSREEEQYDSSSNPPIDKVFTSNYIADSAQGKDQLGITHDVDAFANLIASKKLKPPLSIGLFGDWGSGKSFFMQKMRGRVDNHIASISMVLEQKAKEELLQFKSAARLQQEAFLDELMVDANAQYDQIQELVKEGNPKGIYQVQALWYDAGISNISDQNQIVDRNAIYLAKSKETVEALSRDKEAADFKEILKQKKVEERNRLINQINRAEKRGEYLFKEMIKEREALAFGFHRNIAQIEFNAWHYIDTNLWASLVTQILNQLSLYVGNKSEEEKKEIKLFEKLATIKAVKAEIKDKRNKIDSEKDKLSDSLDKFEEEKKEMINSLENISLLETVKELFQKDETQDLIKEGMAQLGLDKTADEFRKAREKKELLDKTIQKYESSWGKLVLFWRSIKSMSGMEAILSFLLILAFPALLLYGEKLFELLFPANVEFAKVTAMISLWATVLGKIIQKLNQGLEMAEEGLSYLQSARKQLEDKATQTVNTKIETAKADYESLIRQEEDLKRRMLEVEAESKQIENELDDIEKEKLLPSFLQRRVESGDYQAYLGLISIIREDLDRLSGYLHRKEDSLVFPFEEADGEGEKEEKAESLIREMLLNPQNRIDRIILYIDDLDRCPPEKVVEVLQAVHLILAFPLFVVVVGVDVRWISKSLVKQYGDLLKANTLEEEENGDRQTLQFSGEATHFDYLEKIFQIPFRLKPMNRAAKEKFIDSLLLPDLEKLKQENEPEDSEAGKESGKEAETPAANPIVQLKKVAFSRDELAFIKRLSPILSNSPRTLKRYVNVCNLIKSHQTWGAAASDEDPDNDRELSAYKAMIFILALITGLPELTELLIDDLEEARKLEDFEEKPLSEFIKKFQEERAEEILKNDELHQQWKALKSILRIDSSDGTIALTKKEKEDMPLRLIKAFLNLKLEEVEKHAHAASRFSFRFSHY